MASDDKRHRVVATTTLGRDGPLVSRIGLGTWAHGGPWESGLGIADDRESIEVIRRAARAGITWIDTAPAYGLGHAEEVVGQALRGLSEEERPLIFTKCGVVWDVRGRLRHELSRESIHRECEESCRRLNVNQIDLLQIHWPMPSATLIEESWLAMVDLVTAGKVRWIGVSNYDVCELERCEAIRHVDSHQLPLSLIRREAIENLLPWCLDHGTAALAYSPLEIGLLTGRFSKEAVASLASDDYRQDHDAFQEPALTRNLLLVEQLRKLAAAIGFTLPELAVAWVLSQPGLTGAIVGARRVDQIEAWVRADQIALSGEVLADICTAIRDAAAGYGQEMPQGSAGLAAR